MLDSIMWDHITWCLDDLVRPLWREHQPSDHRFERACAARAAYAAAPDDPDARSALIDSGVQMWAAIDDLKHHALSPHLKLTIEYAAQATVRALSAAPAASVMRDVRLFSSLAVVHHTLYRHSAGDALPIEMLHIEAETMEIVQHRQDLDINQRLQERALCRSTRPPTPLPEMQEMT